MDQVALYESQEPDDDISNDAAAHDDQRSDDDVGSQVYEAIRLPECVYKVVSIVKTADDDADTALQESDAETVLQVSDEESEEVGARPDAHPRGFVQGDSAAALLPALLEDRPVGELFRG